MPKVTRNRGRGIDLGLASCHNCEQVAFVNQPTHTVCPRCGAALHLRKPNSAAKSCAFLLAAMIMYVPANMLPIMSTEYFGDPNPDTILSGVVYFVAHGDWPLAIVIFTASVLVPLLKMLSIAYLLIAMSQKNKSRQREKGKLYYLTELIGRWSMVDVFVVALLAVLVQFGAIVNISAGSGAFAFAAMVVFSMISAHALDPRLLWDNPGVNSN